MQNLVLKKLVAQLKMKCDICNNKVDFADIEEHKAKCKANKWGSQEKMVKDKTKDHLIYKLESKK